MKTNCNQNKRFLIATATVLVVAILWQTAAYAEGNIADLGESIEKLGNDVKDILSKIKTVVYLCVGAGFILSLASSAVSYSKGDREAGSFYLKIFFGTVAFLVGAGIFETLFWDK